MAEASNHWGKCAIAGCTSGGCVLCTVSRRCARDWSVGSAAAHRAPMAFPEAEGFDAGLLPHHPAIKYACACELWHLGDVPILSIAEMHSPLDSWVLGT